MNFDQIGLLLKKIANTKIVEDIALITIVAGLVGYIAKVFIVNYFDKNLKAFEKKLESDQKNTDLLIEQKMKTYESELLVSNNKINGLNVKRLDLLTELYEYVSVADMKMKLMASMLKVVTGNIDLDNIKRINEINDAKQAYNTFLFFYEKKKIFFNKESCELIDTLLKEYHSVHLDYSFGLNSNDREVNAGKRISEETPKVLEMLQNDFRKQLGIDN